MDEVTAPEPSVTELIDQLEVYKGVSASNLGFPTLEHFGYRVCQALLLLLRERAAGDGEYKPMDRWEGPLSVTDWNLNVGKRNFGLADLRYLNGKEIRLTLEVKEWAR